MQLKIALCDDSEEDRRYIEKLVRSWADVSGGLFPKVFLVEVIKNMHYVNIREN